MFGKTKQKTIKSKIEELELKSEDAISVFKDTLESLSEIEIEVESVIHRKQAKIKDIESEIDFLNERKTKNGKFIGKLKEFFE